MKYNEQKVKADIEQCTTKKQVMQVLKANNIKVYRDDSKEVGDGKGFSIWLDEYTRIYKPSRRRDAKMRYQKWSWVHFVPTGIPTFFATGLPEY